MPFSAFSQRVTDLIRTEAEAFFGAPREWCAGGLDPPRPCGRSVSLGCGRAGAHPHSRRLRWELLGYSQTANFSLTRIATVVGVYGLSFEIMLVNSVFASAFLVGKEQRKRLLTAAFFEG